MKYFLLIFSLFLVNIYSYSQPKSSQNHGDVLKDQSKESLLFIKSIESKRIDLFTELIEYKVISSSSLNRLMEYVSKLERNYDLSIVILRRENLNIFRIRFDNLLQIDLFYHNKDKLCRINKIVIKYQEELLAEKKIREKWRANNPPPPPTPVRKWTKPEIK